MTMQRKRGFTLIELMIVVAIIAILAAIAVPWWGRYTYRARRADGQNLLMHIAQAEERYYTDYNYYPLSAGSLGYTGTPTSEHGYYTVTLAASPAASAGQGYVATVLDFAWVGRHVMKGLCCVLPQHRGPNLDSELFRNIGGWLISHRDHDRPVAGVGLKDWLCRRQYENRDKG